MSLNAGVTVNGVTVSGEICIILRTPRLDLKIFPSCRTDCWHVSLLIDFELKVNLGDIAQRTPMGQFSGHLLAELEHAVWI